MNKTLDELIKENTELLDFVVGKLMNANMKFALIRELSKLESPLTVSAALRAEAETIEEGVDLINEVLNKIVNSSSYTDKDMYILMKKYKGVV